jgi:hypothetical protein
MQLPNNDIFFAHLQEYSFQITMRQEWNDKRLSYEDRLTSKMKGKLKTVHSPTRTLKYVESFCDQRINNTGQFTVLLNLETKRHPYELSDHTTV